MKAPVARRAAPRRTAPATIDEYFIRVSEPGRSVLTKLRAAIRPVLPRDTNEIISYQIPAFARDGVIVWYAAFADHVSVFPRGSILTKFKDELSGFKTSKGTVQFPLDKPLPIALIRRIVKARLAEHEAAAMSRRSERKRMSTAISGGVAHDLPKDLRDALRSDPGALASWETLTPLARNEWICWVMSVKTAETRREHVERVCSELHEGMRRPCCWMGCVHRTDKPLSRSQKFLLGRRSKN